ncbi:MAG: hypothetical protein Q8L88_07195 [Bacteroidota bacterium]|nr:hypothetical protein [Bacteroidota bacterium]
MKKLFLPIAFVISIWSFGFGQSLVVTPTITDADIINASVLVDPLAEKIMDIAPTSFSLRFINNPQLPIKASMTIEAYVTLEEDRSKESIFGGSGKAKTKKPFLIPKDGRTFTSRDADNPSSDIDIDHTVNEDLKKKLKDKILETTSGGRVPSGLYEIKITITVDSVGGVPKQETPIVIERSINVTNPTTAVLDVPFSNGYVYPTPFPQFQWTYDTRSVKLSVYELRPEHQSLEDAIGSSAPYLQVQIFRLIGRPGERKIPTNISSFTYPQTAVSQPGIVEFTGGVRQLERGKMYVVVLDGISTAFGFEVDPIRTIRSFIISDPQGQVVVNILQTTFSSGEFQDIFNLIQDQNLQLNANGITLNGVILSPQDLQKLLLEKKNSIISVRFED